jgi:hypothetical protein
MPESMDSSAFWLSMVCAHAPVIRAAAMAIVEILFTMTLLFVDGATSGELRAGGPLDRHGAIKPI